MKILGLNVGSVVGTPGNFSTVTVTSTTDSTSTSTGSIVTAGGVGIAKALWVGGLTNIAGSLTVGPANSLFATGTASPNVGIGTTSPNIAGFGSTWAILTLRGNGAAGAGASAIEMGSNTASASAGDYVGRLDFRNGANYVANIRCLVGAADADAGLLQFQTANTSGTMQTAFAIDSNAFINTVALAESTGAGSALLGSNSPASTLTAPYKWIKQLVSDGSVVYYPVWK